MTSKIKKAYTTLAKISTESDDLIFHDSIRCVDFKSYFESKIHQAVFVSATPADYEFEKSGGVVVEQIIRATGLMDPDIDVRPTEGQIDDLIEEIQEVVARGSRVLVTTLTKRMAEDLAS